MSYKTLAEDMNARINRFFESGGYPAAVDMCGTLYEIPMVPIHDNKELLDVMHSSHLGFDLVKMKYFKGMDTKDIAVAIGKNVQSTSTLIRNEVSSLSEAWLRDQIEKTTDFAFSQAKQSLGSDLINKPIEEMGLPTLALGNLRRGYNSCKTLGDVLKLNAIGSFGGNGYGSIVRIISACQKFTGTRHQDAYMQYAHAAELSGKSVSNISILHGGNRILNQEVAALKEADKEDQRCSDFEHLIANANARVNTQSPATQGLTHSPSGPGVPGVWDGR